MSGSLQIRDIGGTVSRAALFFGGIVVLCAGFTVDAAAQAVGGPGKLAQPADARDSAGRILFQADRQLSYAVSTAVNRRLAPSPSSPGIAPLGYAGTTVLLADAPALLETPAAPETQAAPLWNVWLDGQTSRTDWDDPVAGIKGPLSTVSAGADRTIADRGLIGVMVSGERSDLDTNENNGSLESRGAGAGVYAGWQISDFLVADALVLWKDLSNDVTTPISTGSYDSTRWQAAANLTGYIYRDAWRFSPTVGLSWSNEDQDSYFDSLGFFFPEESLTAVTVTSGLQVGYGISTTSGGTIEPWLGVGLDYEANREDVPAGADDPSRFDLRVNGGVNAQFSDAVSLTLTGEAGALNRGGYATYRGAAQLSVRF